MIAANRFQTQIIRSVDPVEGDDLKVELAPVPTDLPPNQRLHGKVVDDDGKPVFGAVVSIWGALQNDQNWQGRVKNVDKASVTGADGKFLLTSTEEYKAWRLSVNATGFVELSTELLATGDTDHKLTLDPGSSVTGTVIKDGKPIPGVTIGICQTNRGSDQFAGEYVIATDQNGQFLFNSVIPGSKMTIYSKMEKGNSMITEIAEFTSEKSGASAKLGELELRPAKTITGKITLVDGRPIPKNFRVLVGREYAWDTQTVDVDEHGYFKVDGLPKNEAVKISVRINDYSIDHSKTKFQVTRSGIAVFTEGKLEQVEIFLKPKLK